MDLPGPRKSDPPVHLRRILVYSSANAAGAAKASALKLAKATEDLDRLVRTAGTRFHPTADAVAARVQAIAARRRVKAVPAHPDQPPAPPANPPWPGTSTRPRSTLRPPPTAGTRC